MAMTQALKPINIVVEIAKHILGADWMQNYVQRATHGGMEKVLL